MESCCRRYFLSSRSHCHGTRQQVGFTRDRHTHNIPTVSAVIGYGIIANCGIPWVFGNPKCGPKNRPKIASPYLYQRCRINVQHVLSSICGRLVLSDRPRTCPSFYRPGLLPLPWFSTKSQHSFSCRHSLRRIPWRSPIGPFTHLPTRYCPGYTQ